MILAADAAELVVQAAVGIVAAGIGAGATLYATKASARGALSSAIEADRAERRAADDQSRLAALRTLLTEMQLNSAAIPESHIWHAHLLLPQTALLQAMPYLITLPPDVAIAIEAATHSISRYNGAASYSNDRVPVGNGAADQLVRDLGISAQAAINSAVILIEAQLDKEA